MKCRDNYFSKFFSRPERDVGLIVGSKKKFYIAFFDHPNGHILYKRSVFSH